MKKFIGFLLSILLLFLSFNFVRAQENKCSDLSALNPPALEQCRNDLEKALNLSIAATRPLESQLRGFQLQIDGIKKRVSQIEASLIVKRANIEKGYKELAEKKKIFDATVAQHYIEGYNNNLLAFFLSSSTASELIQNFAYQKAKANQDKAIITNIALLIHDLETQRKSLESEQTQITSLKASLDAQSAKLDEIVSGAKAYQGVLSSKIAQISARQQEILGRRLAGLNIPRSAGTGAPACIDDRDKDPGFGPRIAFFTYGVPNRTGLNQYGAKTRAGFQGHEDILRAYYEGISFETKGNINIKVQGYGEMPLETYLLGIYEMPEDWPMEALKAQVIAARSYALAYTNNGAGEICTTQSCQVYKQPHKEKQWKTAVEETAGKVMINGGQVIKAWYSSTHGGYAFPTSELPGWSATAWTKRVIDTTTGNASGFGDLRANAYDRDSPWFYCDWGSRGEYRSHNYQKTAWMRPEEVADIVNVILLARADSSTKEKLYQTDKPHPYGGEIWDEERVKNELRAKNITPFKSVSNIDVSVDFGSGRVTSVSITGDSSIPPPSGAEFKDWFNVRAPANIQIVGPLYNVEQK